MARDRLARAMAETLINKVVIDIKSDPERGLRNIIDLALIVPRGKFSRNLFSIVQRILSDEDSAYYTLVKSVASDVDTEILKKFTFNIGVYRIFLSALRPWPVKAVKSEEIFPR